MKKEIKKLFPTNDEISKARQDYNKRAHSGHFSGNEPWYHFQAGIEWIINEIKKKNIDD